MNTRFFLLSIFLICFQMLWAQQENPESEDLRFKVYTYEGVTFMDGQLDSINILDRKPTDRQIRKGRKRLAKFTRLRYNIHKVYPYALKVSEVLQEIDQELAELPEDTKRRKYVKSKEQALFSKYEKDLRKMTRSQGKVLVKLVCRQTGKTTYELIKENKNGASAFFWQSIGLLFGINLKSDYDDEEDEMIEDIVAELEGGGWNIVYRAYDYRLE
ncbi:DUF4294 domain-containing protein [Pontibacter sp. G13]|uniref:DUF4294 domain-containing protein n=1 Tax=Pontibacter sp. G13 TaxID=3074898 RepID=UPI00288A8880|nr:DUF4294 domain-containing protein [Pontibacter sp. G13]WNJ17240.1 DUF4294 domain-containing protein [Pontibacter sp. G13]